MSRRGREKKCAIERRDKESSHPISMAKPTLAQWIPVFLLAFSAPSNLSVVLSSTLWGVSIFETENPNKIEILLRALPRKGIVARSWRYNVETAEYVRLFVPPTKRIECGTPIILIEKWVGRSLSSKLDGARIILSRCVFLNHICYRNGRDIKLIIRTIITLRYSASRFLI